MGFLSSESGKKIGGDSSNKNKIFAFSKYPSNNICLHQGIFNDIFLPAGTAFFF